MKKKILVVDDDEALRSLLTEILEDKNYEVIGAADGKIAQSLVALSFFDLIISDVRMPHMTGVELLKYVKQTKDTPFILMTGFSDICEAQEAFKIGAADFVTKPFNKDQIVSVIEKVIAGTHKTGSQTSGDFRQIHIDEFLSEKSLAADIYIRLSEKKFIKIAYRGQLLDKDRVISYKEKRISHLFVENKTPGQFSGDLRFEKEITDSILEQAYLLGVEKKMISHALGVLRETLAQVNKDKNLYELVKSLKNHSVTLYTHSVGVSFYGAMLAKEIKWAADISLFKISLAGLLHDVGLTKFDKILCEKDPENFSKEEKITYEKHSMAGRDILNGIPGVPGEVVLAAMGHHGNSAGIDSLSPLIRLIAVTDGFCDLTLNKPRVLTPDLAVEKMILKNPSAYGAVYDPYFLSLLMKIFKINIKPEFENYFRGARSA